jgi:hypothetical protein
VRGRRLYRAAAPGPQTLGFFHRNLVMEYSRQRAIADHVNVDGIVYENRDRIAALEIIYDQPYSRRRLSYGQFQELAQEQAGRTLTPQQRWWML